ncbi:MAG: PD40 domain-containing protein [Bacteroidetes bacterium]|nr:PD40 domain-containing protein [Bacteroidota bacterium]
MQKPKRQLFIALAFASAAVGAIGGCSDPVATSPPDSFWSRGGPILYTRQASVVDAGQVRVIGPDGAGDTSRWAGTIPCPPRLGHAIIVNYLAKTLSVVPIPDAGTPRQFRVEAGGTITAVAYAPDAARVAYVVRANGTPPLSSLYICDTNGTAAPMAADVANSSYPVFSPDGNRVAFYAGADQSEIHVLDLKSQRIDTIAAGAFPWTIENVDWSPGGDSILFAGRSNDGGTRHICIVSASGGPQRSLTAGIGGDNRWPLWSPDGGRIAFIHNNELWVMKADGTDGEQLTHISSSPTQYRIAINPQWSPDASMIVFSAIAGNPLQGVLQVVDVSTHRVNVLARDVLPGFWCPPNLHASCRAPERPRLVARAAVHVTKNQWRPMQRAAT